MQARPFVVCTRLSEEERQQYERILNEARRKYGWPCNKSEAFRLVLKECAELAKTEAMKAFYANLEP
jgi:hypothetical protein